jgi:hypothetical protein
MAKQSTPQRKTVGRVMHEWKHGDLESSRGGKVRSRRQAVAIALSEAGASNQQSPGQNRRGRGRRSDGPTRAQLYQQAMRRKIPGRSRMSKAELQRALSR